MKHFTETFVLAALLASCQPQPKSDYSWEQDLKHRQLIEYRQTYDEVKEGIKEYIPDVTDEQIAQWEKDRSLECIEIDGEKHYFKYAVNNLFRIDSTCKAILRAKQQADNQNKAAGKQEPSLMDKNIEEILTSAPESDNHLAAPKKMRIRFTLSVDSGVVPAGKTIRCWLPFPRADVDRQSDVRLVETSEKDYKMSDPTCVHSTVYMEKKAEAGGKTVFYEVFEYTASGSWFDADPEKALPYDTTSENYKKYTAEREKHVVFTPEMRELAAKLTAGETNPVAKAKKIFAYIDETCPWASSCDYSIMENIPMYVYNNHHGDCGMQTLLFITLCRISGVPARWQSGLVVPPSGAGMHDWGEAYFEGIGWIPVDVSRGLDNEAPTEKLKWFNFGGMDSWRLVFNSDYGMDFSPKKTYPRSDTVDLQRGEVEWDGGNLYFDQWDWDVEVEHLD